MSDDVVAQPPGLASSVEELFARAAASQVRAGHLHLVATRTVSASRILRGQQREASSASDFRQELLQTSRYARLLARLATMPAIEQAKGILMAQSGCSPDEAFDMLRRASQRSNIPVRQLAEQIRDRSHGTSVPGPGS